MIKAFCGRVGSGKTLSMVYEVLPWVKRGFKIVANTPIQAQVARLLPPGEAWAKKRLIERRINSPKIVTQLEEFFKLFLSETDTIFCMDEAAAWMSNYRWDKVPDEMYNRFFQNRKYNIHLLYTTQYFTFVAKKLRQMTDISVECSAPIRGFADKRIPYSKGTPIVVRNVFYNILYYEQKVYSMEVEKKFIEGRRFIFGSGLKEVFKSYDTKKDVSKGL